jgi:hypothetical protein
MRASQSRPEIGVAQRRERVEVGADGSTASQHQSSADEAKSGILQASDDEPEELGVLRNDGDCASQVQEAERRDIDAVDGDRPRRQPAQSGVRSGKSIVSGLSASEGDLARGATRTRSAGRGPT